MKLTQLGSLYKLIRGESRTMRKSVAKQPRQRASAFVLESLENRVLLSATPMDVTTTEPVVTAAVVTTDKPDYAPGETALITTSNTDTDGLKFGDGELVQFQVTRTDGIEDAPMGNLPWYVTDGVGGFNAYQEFDANGQAIDRNADGMADWIRPDNDLSVNGSISTDWYVEDQYLGASLLLTATGQASGAVATTEFTDSPRLGSVTVGSQTGTVSQGIAGSATFSIQVSRGATTSGSVTTTIGISGTLPTADGGGATALPAGITASGVLGVQSIGSSGFSATLTLSVANTVAAGNYTFYIYADGPGADNAVIGTGTLVVSASTVTPTVTLTAADATYTGSAYATSNLTTTILNGATDVSGFGTVSYVYYASNGTTVIPAPTNVGNYYAKAVFTSNNAGYNNTESTLDAFEITQATATIVVNGYSNVYDGLYHGATLGSATGVNGEDLSGSVTLGGETFKDVPGGTATWSFSNGNYFDQNNSVAITITQADLAITIGNASKVFGQTIDLGVALGTTVNTGINGENFAITYTSAGVPLAALVGPYAINGTVVVGGTGSLSNYNVTINSGTLTVITPSVITTVQDGANLIIVGTGGCDTITVNATNPNSITVNGVGSYLVNTNANGHVIVYGMACDDNISLTGNVNLEAHGGDGNDTITGGAWHDVIFGDLGNDTLTGSAGNDVLMGGAGSDRLVGSAGHDILISGELDDAYGYDDLRTISDNWASNWNDYLDSSVDPEITDDDVVDESVDQLTGSSGHDWFIVGTGDKITDINSKTKDGDTITNI